MNTEYKIIFALLSIFYFLFSDVPLVHASSFSVTPVVIDERAKARDILKESVTLTNNTARKLNTYTFVNNISRELGKQEFLDPSRADHSSSLANWIAISRGVIELAPGETRTIDFQIDVNLRAKPGVYHAVIYFGEGSRRTESEKKLPEAPAVMVNLEVLEDIKERLQLKKFIPDKVFFTGFPVSFSYDLENIGNRELTPTGEIRIYDRRGEEVGAVDVNYEGVVLGRETTEQLAGIWEASGGFGRYKAILDLEYGSTQRGTLQDTVFFWVIPWKMILIIFGIMAGLVIIFTFLLYRRLR